MKFELVAFWWMRKTIYIILDRHEDPVQDRQWVSCTTQPRGVKQKQRFTPVPEHNHNSRTIRIRYELFHRCRNSKINAKWKWIHSYKIRITFLKPLCGSCSLLSYLLRVKGNQQWHWGLLITELLYGWDDSLCNLLNKSWIPPPQ